MVESKLIESTDHDKKGETTTNLFQSEKAPEVIVMRQEPEKIEEIKQFLYTKIKEELIEEMKKNAVEKDEQINLMIEEEKKRKLEEIMEQRRIDEDKKKTEEENIRIVELEQQRKKINFDIRVEPIQYAEENVHQYFDALFEIHPNVYQRLYINDKPEDFLERLKN